MRTALYIRAQPRFRSVNLFSKEYEPESRPECGHGTEGIARRVLVYCPQAPYSHSIVSRQDNRLILQSNLFSLNTPTVGHTVKNLRF
jgi:hypothetical protein